MKLFAFIKSTIKTTLKNLPSLVFTFSIFPLLLGLVVGYFNEDQFVPSVEMPVMKIMIKDEDNSVESNNLIGFLEGQEMKSLVEKKEEDMQYVITIPKGYEESLLNNGNVPVEIEVTDEGSESQGNMLAEIIDKYNEEVHLNYMIQRSIEEETEIPEEREELAQRIYSEIAEMYSRGVIENNIITTKKSLTSYEHFSITFFGYMLFLIMTSLINGEYIARENGVYSRIMATPLTDVQYLNYNLISSYLFVVLFNLLYVLTYRISGLSFKGSLPLLILIVLIQSLLGTVLATLFSLILNRKASSAILNALIIIQLIGGVTYVPLKKIGDGLLARIVEKYSPDALIVSTYKDYLIYDDFNSIKIGLLLMVVVSLVLYIISLIVFKTKRGEAW